MPNSNYPRGFAGGVTLRNMPAFEAFPGRVVWVDSNGGSNDNTGSFDRPVARLAQAFDLVRASKGDVIQVKAGHSETITGAAGLAFDVAGVAVIGHGRGAARPTINFTTAVGASLTITAEGVSVRNFLFTGGFDALTGPIAISAADVALVDIETRDVTGQATDFIATTAAADRFLIDGWTHRGAAAAGADAAITIVGGDGATIRNFWIDGNFAISAIENVTTAATNLTIHSGYIRTRNAADVAITLVATTTGNVGPDIFVRIFDDAVNITEALVGADMQFFDPIMICNADNQRGLQWNGTASADA